MQIPYRFWALLAFSCYFGFVPSAHAQDITLGGSAGGNLGTVVMPTQPAPLRTSPPGFLGTPGEKTGKTSEGESYVILEGKQIPKFFSSDRWIKIAPVKPDGTVSPHDGGWVYWGQNEMDASPNFKAVVPGEIDPAVRLGIDQYILQEHLKRYSPPNA